MRRQRSLFKYFDDRRWAEAFLEGQIRFQPLSTIRRWEEQGVRGDRNEGTALFAPAEGLDVTNLTQGTRLRIPAHRFASAVRSDEIFVHCLSRTWSQALWDELNAVACVEVFNVPSFCARVSAALPPGAHFPGRPGRERIGTRVEYYRAQDPIGARWTLPDRIAHSKLHDFARQDEYRLVFSFTDALSFENVSLTIEPQGIAGVDHGGDHEPFDLEMPSVADICLLRGARPDS